MDIGVVEKLLSPEGWALLSSLPPYDDATALHLGASLREAGYDPELVSAALTQCRLRARAQGKLGDFAAGMLFTSDGLEQATRLELGARHASRYRQAGIEHVWDLGCGIGADAMAMSALGLQVTAVDQDPATAAIAGTNLRYFPDSRTRVGDAAAIADEITALTDGAWFDPARRSPGRHDAQGRTRRTFRLDELTPSFNTLVETAARVPATGAKLSPSLAHSAVPAGCEAQWTSYAGEVLECTLWWGPLVTEAGRSALVLRPPSADGSAPAVDITLTERDALPGQDRPTATAAPSEGDWIWDPDKAVVRAGLTGALVAATDGTELAAGAGYVTAASPSEVAYARRYQISAAMPLQHKTLRHWLRSQDIGRLTIKKRGITLDADRLRKDLRLDGRGNELTCIITRVGDKQYFLAVEPRPTTHTTSEHTA
nr:class I SAM-dependent methyltransferase [Austwickia chelonae]